MSELDSLRAGLRRTYLDEQIRVLRARDEQIRVLRALNHRKTEQIRVLREALGTAAEDLDGAGLHQCAAGAREILEATK
jgi:hypothetical protein